MTKASDIDTIVQECDARKVDGPSMAGYQKSTSRIKNEEGDTKKSFETVVPV